MKSKAGMLPPLLLGSAQAQRTWYLIRWEGTRQKCSPSTIAPIVSRFALDMVPKDPSHRGIMAQGRHQSEPGTDDRAHRVHRRRYEVPILRCLKWHVKAQQGQIQMQRLVLVFQILLQDFHRQTWIRYRWIRMSPLRPFVRTSAAFLVLLSALYFCPCRPSSPYSRARLLRLE